MGIETARVGSQAQKKNSYWQFLACNGSKSIVDVSSELVGVTNNLGMINTKDELNQ